MKFFCLHDNTTHYHLRDNNEFFQPRVRSINHGAERVRFKGPQLWQMLPPAIRNSQSLCQFKVMPRLYSELGLFKYIFLDIDFMLYKF